MHIKLPFELFDEADRQDLQDYICILCKNVLYDPVVSEGECYCRACITTYMATNTLSPLTNNPISRVFTQYPNKFRNKIYQMKVKCINHLDGCKSQLKVEQLENHLNKDCEFELINCKNVNCKTRVFRGKVNEHLNICPESTVTCKNCRGNFLLKDKKFHDSNCPKRLVKCCLCQREVCFDMMEKHVSESCPNKEEECLLNPIGCKSKIKRVDVEKHMKDNYLDHFNIFVKDFINFKQNTLSLLELFSKNQPTDVRNDFLNKKREIDESFSKKSSTSTISTTIISTPNTTMNPVSVPSLQQFTPKFIQKDNRYNTHNNIVKLAKVDSKSTNDSRLIDDYLLIVNNLHLESNTSWAVKVLNNKRNFIGICYCPQGSIEKIESKYYLTVNEGILLNSFINKNASRELHLSTLADKTIKFLFSVQTNTLIISSGTSREHVALNFNGDAKFLYPFIAIMGDVGSELQINKIESF